MKWLILQTAPTSQGGHVLVYIQGLNKPYEMSISVVRSYGDQMSNVRFDIINQTPNGSIRVHGTRPGD